MDNRQDLKRKDDFSGDNPSAKRSRPSPEDFSKLKLVIDVANERRANKLKEKEKEKEEEIEFGKELKKFIASLSKEELQDLGNSVPKRKFSEITQETETTFHEDTYSDNEEQYILFMSEILAYKLNNNNESNYKNDMEFLINYFSYENNTYNFIWPKNNKKIFINISNHSIKVYTCNINDKNESHLLLSILIDNNNFQIEKVNLVQGWKKGDIHDLINLFNFVFSKKLSYTEESEKYRETDNLEKQPNGKAREGVDIIEISKFVDFCTQKPGYTFLQYFMTHHTRVEEEKGDEQDICDKGEKPKNQNVFWLAIPESDVELKIAIKPQKFKENPIEKEDYYSYVFKQEEYFKREYGKYNFKELTYFRVKVYEFKDAQKRNLLDFWFDPGLAFGELHDLYKGKEVSGTSIMKDKEGVFDQLNWLFRMKYQYTCDATCEDEALSDRDPNQIVFRVLFSIAKSKATTQDKVQTEGLTFYERFGWELIDCNGDECGFPVAKSETTKIYQNAEQCKQARKELQELPVDKLFEFFLKEETNSCKQLEEKTRSSILHELCQKYLKIDLYRINPNETKIPTFGELTQVVKEARTKTPVEANKKIRSKKVSDVKTLYTKLQTVPNKHLCNPFDPNADQNEKGEHRYYTNLNKIIWSSYFRKATLFASERRSELIKYQGQNKSLEQTTKNRKCK